jgi:hypothetical protein
MMPMNQNPVDETDLAVLLKAVEAFHRRRSGAASDRAAALFRGVCLTLVAGRDDAARAALADVRPDDPPEARVCALWLQDAGADQWEAVAREPLWPPVQALAFRALTDHGRRRTLAGLLPKTGPLSLVQADAWLDACHDAPDAADWARRVTPADELLPAGVRAGWLTFLIDEAALAWGGWTPSMAAGLNAFANVSWEQPPRAYAEAQTRRLAVRAVSAQVRLSLAQFAPDPRPLDTPAGQQLPPWEIAYLRGLVGLQSPGGQAVPVADLGGQTALRLMLATTFAKHSPEEALQALDCPEPTWEVLLTRAALLARLRRFDEAQQTLTAASARPGPGHEAARCRWAQALPQYRRQEALLRAALAERRGDWIAAKAATQAAKGGPITEALVWSRRSWTSLAELDTLPDGRGWRRSAVQQDQQQATQKVGAIPLTGDALFFRAAARTDARADGAARDAQTLARQRAWLDREAAVGGGRLLALGDLLLRLNCADDAVRVYQRAGSESVVQERLAVARVLSATRNRQEHDAAALALQSPWPHLLAAVGFLVAGRGDQGGQSATKAAQLGGPDLLCRGLAAVAARDGSSFSDGDLMALKLPADVGAVVRAACGLGGEVDRLAALARTLGDRWLTQCPMKPEAAARRLLSTWCDDGNWPEALAFADALGKSGQQWAVDVAVLVRLRHALARAERGELTEATQVITSLA